MKKFTILITLILVSNIISAQWVQQNPNYPDTCVLKDIFFIDQLTGWANGDGYPSNPEIGNFYHTENGGLNWFSWQYYIQWLFIPMNSIYFSDQNFGCGVWDNGSIYNTSDGGSNWINNSINNQYDFTDVFFTDSLIGWTIGTKPGYMGSVNHKVFHTSDGGSNWSEQVSWGGFGTMASSVIFLNENKGWAAAGDVIKNTNDGGVTWDSQALGFICRSLNIVDENNLWIVGTVWLPQENGVIYNSEDGGTTWVQKIGDTIPFLNDIIFIDSNLGWAVGDSGTILHTFDGGETWKYQESGTTADLFSLSFIDENHGWICGDSSIILHTNNGGITGNTPTLSESDLVVKSYPNPVKNCCSIEFELIKPELVNIQFFNAMGEKVIDLENKIYPSGLNKVDWNTGSFPNGIYFCNLQIGHETITIKLIKSQ
ncbi:MAG: T9SS type A sorting domain-containing protein [Bacteroidetes bacterium]|nr:T9SS type A sorting domain-containing protein [Bacteroidota bacterium]